MNVVGWLHRSRRRLFEHDRVADHVHVADADHVNVHVLRPSSFRPWFDPGAYGIGPVSNTAPGAIPTVTFRGGSGSGFDSRIDNPEAAERTAPAPRT